MKKMKNTLLMILLTSLISSCATYEPIQIKEIKFDPTPIPSNEALTEIENIKNDIGKINNPIKIKQNGVTYIAFTPDDVKKITAKLELMDLLEKTVNNQYNIMVINVKEINEFKRLVEIQQTELMVMNQLIERLDKQYNRLNFEKQAEGIMYKFIVIGQMIALILLI
jgi:hypothetical protein